MLVSNVHRVHPWGSRIGFDLRICFNGLKPAIDPSASCMEHILIPRAHHNIPFVTYRYVPCGSMWNVYRQT